MSSENNAQARAQAGGRGEWYEKRRNELVSMLNEALALNVPEKYDAELRSTAKKCKENAFEIALVGEFAGGKSTTFNALCDGRDISPRGLGGGGIKTSAAAISAQNISGDETKNGLSEWAEVVFKQPVALVLGMAKVLRPVLSADDEFYLTRDEKTKSELFTDSGFCELVKIDDNSHHEALKRAIDKLWNKWEQDKSSLDDDTLDQLRIATLQLRFYGTPEYEQIVRNTVLPVNEFQKLVAFPKDWAMRWLDGKNADFKLEEVAFVFIESVLVRLHSDNLARLGCRITDCPGLFANSYDTAVAKHVIQNADGIWYLIGGEKQIGEKDLEIIKAIKSMGMLEKTDATCNLKGPHEQKIAEVMEATKAVLKSKGYSLEVVPYNARLAFLSMQGNLLLNHSNNFSDFDLKNMRVDAKDKTGEAKPEKMWCKMVSRLGGQTELEDVEEIDELNSDAVQIVRKESYIDDIIGKLEGEVISKKARSILIDKGSLRAAAALADYEGVLKIREDAATVKEEEWKAKVREAEKKLQDFVERATQLVKDSPLVATKEHFAKNIAEELLDRALNDEFIEEISSSVALILKTVGKNFYWTYKKMIEDVQSAVTPLLEETFANSFTTAMAGLHEFKGFNDVEKNSHRLSENIRILWEDRNMNDEDLFYGIEIPELSAACVEFGAGYINNNIFSENSAIASIAKKGRNGFLSVMIKQILLPMILVAIGNAICFPLTVVAIVAYKFYQHSKSDDKCISEIIQSAGKLVPKISPELKKIINNVEFRKKLENSITKVFLESIEMLTNGFNQSLCAMEMEFRNTRCKPIEETFRMAQAERQRIADEANRIRATQIQPLRERINTFEKTVESELLA